MDLRIATFACAVSLALALPVSGAVAQMRQGTGPEQGCAPGMGMMCMMGDQPRMGTMDERAATRVEQRLGALKGRLKITEAQSKAWQDFAASLREAAKAMSEQRRAMQERIHGGTLPERLDAHEAMLASHLEQLRKAKAAANALYAALTDEQKKEADKAIMGPMMGGRMGEPMHRR
jgi:hypothetical protein